jgi:hypothetical protein
MFSGRAALEDLASSRARRELTALEQRAPFTRMADRCAGFFLPITLLAAAARGR